MDEQHPNFNLADLGVVEYLLRRLVGPVPGAVGRRILAETFCDALLWGIEYHSFARITSERVELDEERDTFTIASTIDLAEIKTMEDVCAKYFAALHTWLGHEESAFFAATKKARTSSNTVTYQGDVMPPQALWRCMATLESWPNRIIASPAFVDEISENDAWESHTTNYGFRHRRSRVRHVPRDNGAVAFVTHRREVAVINGIPVLADTHRFDYSSKERVLVARTYPEDGPHCLVLSQTDAAATTLAVGAPEIHHDEGHPRVRIEQKLQLRVPQVGTCLHTE